MKTQNQSMRIYHRYLGFFLAGIMAMYALSGILLIFRTTDFLKVDQTKTVTIPADTKPEYVGRALRIREFKVDKVESGILYFREGNYNPATGVATITSKELPRVLEKITDIHKANTRSPLFFLNIFFGVSLLFFVVSSFWMFLPSSNVFKKGLYFALGGIALALLMFLI
jgi:hypothetical protein